METVPFIPSIDSWLIDSYPEIINDHINNFEMQIDFLNDQFYYQFPIAMSIL